MAPPVFIYVGGVVIALGAAYALKQFVYEPYVAPQIEKWAQAFIESRRRAKEELRERRLHTPMAMRSGYGYVHLEEEENEHRRQTGKAREVLSPSPHRRRSEWEDTHSVSGQSSNAARLPMPPAELEKMVEKERLAWAERDLPPNMPVPAPPGLRKRTGSRPASRPASFVEITEGPGIPASAYIPLTPTTTNTGSPRPMAEVRLPHPLGSPAQGMQQFSAAPLLSPPLSATSPPAPVVRAISPRSYAGRSDLSPLPQAAYAPLQTIEDVTSPLAGEHAVHLVLRSPAAPGREATYALAPSAQGSPYPSRPASALSSVLSPPHSSLSLPSIARSHSWTNVSRGTSALSDADVLSQSSRDVFGTDDEEDGVASELGSVSDLGSAWEDVSRRSGMSGSEHHVRL